MKFFWKKEHPSKNVNYQELTSVLENGIIEELTKYLWQTPASSVNYLPLTYDMLLKLKKPAASGDSLSIHKTITDAGFELIIFNVPWSTDELKYYPIIIDKKTGKIVGILLPFNELLHRLSEKDSDRITNLGVSWIGFVMERKP